MILSMFTVAKAIM